MSTPRERVDACTNRLTDWWNSDVSNSIADLEGFDAYFQTDGACQILTALLDAGGSVPDTVLDLLEEWTDEVDHLSLES